MRRASRDRPLRRVSCGNRYVLWSEEKRCVRIDRHRRRPHVLAPLSPLDGYGGNRDHAISHAYLGLMHAVHGRFDEASDGARRATDLEPDSPILHYISGGVALWARNLDLSERLTQRALDLDESLLNRICV